MLGAEYQSSVATRYGRNVWSLVSPAPQSESAAVVVQDGVIFGVVCQVVHLAPIVMRVEQQLAMISSIVDRVLEAICPEHPSPGRLPRLTTLRAIARHPDLRDDLVAPGLGVGLLFE